jgi:hypothetical protein
MYKQVEEVAVYKYRLYKIQINQSTDS